MDFRQQTDMLADATQTVHRCKVQLEERYKAPGCLVTWAQHVTAEISASITAIPFGKTPKDAIPLELGSESNDILIHLTPKLENEIRELNADTLFLRMTKRSRT